VKSLFGGLPLHHWGDFGADKRKFLNFLNFVAFNYTREDLVAFLLGLFVVNEELYTSH
jgi:hypothetical protein